MSITPFVHEAATPRTIAAPYRSILPAEEMTRLREGLATCHSRRGLTPEANAAIVALCAGARQRGWSPEYLLVALKEACNTSPEITHLTTTSERDAFLAKIVTACIKEFFRTERATG